MCHRSSGGIKSKTLMTFILILLTSSGWAQSTHQLSTNLVLVCVEINLEFVRITEALNPTVREWLNERNTSSKRPLLVFKYIDNKLSFNSNGTDFFINDIPNEPNQMGWVGKILVKDSAIYFEFVNDRESHMRTTLTIDRFTGLYKELKYSPGHELPDFESTGKCAKQNERLF